MSPHGRLPKILDLKNRNELEEYLFNASCDGFEEEELEEDRLDEEEEE